MRLEPPAPLTCEAEIVVSPYCAWRMQKVCFLLLCTTHILTLGRYIS